MKKTITNKKALSWLGFLAIVLVMPMFAFAAPNANLGTLLSDTNFKQIISFGLGLYAAWKWFDYFSGFNPSSAFKDIIVPAVITFLAFKWNDVLGWMKII